MVNFDKYKNDGWGLSKRCFEDIYMILNNSDDKTFNVVEFGSGISTDFILDLNNSGFDMSLYSFDDNKTYASKRLDSKLRLSIVNLIYCNDNDFELLFKNKNFNRDLFKIKTDLPTTRQKNTFYDINDSFFPEKIDLMIVDGPHGNGRSIAFLFGNGKLKSGSYVVIDDYNHYDFLNRFKIIFNDFEIVSESNTGNSDKWNLGGNYIILKIK